MKQTDKYKLSRTLFWDVDYNTIDMDKNAPFIVERVLNRGTIEDFRAILKYYGKQGLKDIALHIRYLDKKALHFCSAFFNAPIETFRCYTQKQLNQTHWDY